jgi:hypothetical protein
LISPSRWVMGGFPPPTTVRLVYQIGNLAPPPVRLDNGQGAGRIAVSFLGADVRVGYAYLLDKFPTVRSTTDTSTLPSHVTVLLDLAYQRQHVVTLDFERPFGPLRVAGEGAWFKLARPLAEDRERSFVMYTAGADYELPTFFDDHKVRVFLEWTQTVATEGVLNEDFIGVMRHPFLRAILVRASYEAGSTFSAEVSAVVSVVQPDYAVFARLTASVANLVKVRLGGTLLGGDPSGSFARFRANSRIEASIEATF